MKAAWTWSVSSSRARTWRPTAGTADRSCISLHAPRRLVAGALGNTAWGVIIRAVAPLALVTARRLTLASKFSNWRRWAVGYFLM